MIKEFNTDILFGFVDKDLELNKHLLKTIIDVIGAYHNEDKLIIAYINNYQENDDKLKLVKEAFSDRIKDIDNYSKYESVIENKRIYNLIVNNDIIDKYLYIVRDNKNERRVFPIIEKSIEFNHISEQQLIDYTNKLVVLLSNETDFNIGPFYMNRLKFAVDNMTKSDGLKLNELKIIYDYWINKPHAENFELESYNSLINNFFDIVISLYNKMGNIELLNYLIIDESPTLNELNKVNMTNLRSAYGLMLQKFKKLLSESHNKEIECFIVRYFDKVDISEEVKMMFKDLIDNIDTVDKKNEEIIVFNRVIKKFERKPRLLRKSNKQMRP